MDSKYYLVLLIMMVQFACKSGSSPRAGQNTDTIGDSLQAYMPRYMLGMENNNIITAYDENVERIHQFDLESGSLVRSFPVRQASKHNILTGRTGSYLIDIADGHLDLIKADGQTTNIPLTFPGTPETAAFSPEEGIFAIADEFGSIGLLEINDSGEILNSWMGGSKLGEQSVALAGDVLAGARLVVSMSDNKLAIIDIRATMEQSAWVFETTEAFSSAVNWIARVPGQENWIMATSQSSLFVYDVVAKTVLSEQSLDGKQVLGRYRDLSPHVYMQDIASEESGSANAESIVIYTINNDGTLRTDTLTNNLDQAEYSVIDLDQGFLSVIERSRVYRVRLSDNLVLTFEQPKSGAKTSITADYIFFQYDSALGYFEKASYVQSEDIETIEGFNIEYL
ncbi:MAG: hypothetical protein HRU09_20320 [Oligoflexales bacterium]|nr:hypothetical protein [Oligoflexales bacterium]